jgi:transcriptional regulator with GAF, ATPase, and Fis domain
MPLAQDPTDLDQALNALQRATMAFADTEADSGQTLQLALHHLIEVTGADAGAIAISDPAGGPAILLAEHCLHHAIVVGRTFLEATLNQASPHAAIVDPPTSDAVISAGITSILCTPVRRRGKTLAGVYLDRRDKPAFEEVALRLATAFASVLAMAFDLTRQRERAEQTADEARAVALHTSDFWRFGSIVTHNRRFSECLQLAERAARSEATVLILGETGVGKEHLARCIHAESSRRHGPFIVINCAAIPDALLESELFGHERGSFTGAVQTRRGKFELAQSGTLFLDEIGEMPLQLQPKLLRVLENKLYSRVGGTEERRADVRIMAATHQDLVWQVENGRFREDLFYRLHVVTVTLPPLRERVEDIASLARGFLQHECKQAGRELSWTEPALRRLSRHFWQGNVRELRNLVERMCALVEGPDIQERDVEQNLPSRTSSSAGMPQTEAAGALGERLQKAEQAIQDLQSRFEGPGGRQDPVAVAAPTVDPPESAATLDLLADVSSAAHDKSYHEKMDEAARQILLETIRECGSMSAAAQALGLSRQHLYAKCKSLGLKYLLKDPAVSQSTPRPA